MFGLSKDQSTQDYMKLKLGIFFLLWCICSVKLVYSQKTANVIDVDSALRTINPPNEKVDFILKFLDEPENAYLDNAVELANRALEISQQTSYALGKVNSMIILGNYYFRKSNFKKSMEFAQKSREMSEDLNFDEELAKTLNLIGNIYSELGDNDNSSRYLFKSLKLFEELNDKEGIARSMGNIGLNFYDQQYYKKSLEYYNSALMIAKSLDNQNLIKQQYNNIAVVYGDLQQYDTSVIFLRKALEISIRLGDKLGQGINIMNIGHIQMKENKYDSALISFRNSIELLTEMNNRSHISECNFNFGYCYYNLNRIDESILYFKKALQEGQSIDYYTIIYESAKMLKQISVGKQDSVSAFKYIQIENKSLDSLYVSQKQDFISKQELQYIYDKKEFEVQLAQNTRDNVMLIIIFSLISGLIILALWFSRYRLKSKFVVVEKEKIELEKEKIQSELIIKDKELTVNLISLIKKNEMLIEISNKLGQLERNASGRETKDSIAKISLELRNNTDDKMLNEFTQRFQEVHAGFYEKLLTTYPDLTQNELKLCALLRLNMTTKDISEITDQQLASIDKARYRLRKKLDLSGPETNLVTFLSKF